MKSIKLLKKHYSEFKNLDITPAKVMPIEKVWYITFFILFLATALSITYWIRPYVYRNDIREYYSIVGALPSFLSVVTIFYASIAYFLIKNKKPITGNYNCIITGSFTVNFLYEFFCSRSFDILDVLAVFAGTLFLIMLEMLKNSIWRFARLK